MPQRQDETAIEYLRRVVHQLDFEDEGLNLDLPSVESVVAFYELWMTYGTDYWAGVVECVQEGADPGPARRFLELYDLDWALPEAEGTD